MRYLWGLVCVMLLLGLATSGVLAEEETCEDDGKPKEGWQVKGKSEEWKDQEIREMVTTVMMARMSRELELTDEQTVLMVRNFAELRDTLSKLGEERGDLIETLREKVDNNAPEAEIVPLLNRLMAVDDDRDAARRDTYAKAGADLTIAQKAKLYIFVQDFEWHMRRLIMKAREIGEERLKRWHDSVLSGEDDLPRGPREGDRFRPKEPPEKETDKPTPGEGS